MNPNSFSPPQVALARLQVQPIVLTGGRTFQDWLARETTLGAEGAEIALREYLRFLALALAATPDQPMMPSPMVAQVWQLHRDDSAAYARFLTEAGRTKLHHRRSQHELLGAPAYAATRDAYSRAFGLPPRRWWPSPRLLIWHGARASGLQQRLLVALLLWFVLFGQDHSPDVSSWIVVTLVLLVVLDHLIWSHVVPPGFRVYGPSRGSLAMAPEQAG